ncbi:MAG: TlpA family protein disulfide reductase [Burkholderiaceae bacterium]|jgi:thiol-disulfide isomerase/thioredoxin|nr:TlpA family protein disulfide reductase [Burkholderiaceae bacterium]
MRLAALHKTIVALLLALLAVAPVPATEAQTVRWTDLTLIDGRVLKASELAGKTVVVEFWASWCPFCARQNPHIQKLHETHGGKGLVVLTFTLDKKDETALQYMKRHGYTFAAARSSPAIEASLGGRRALPEVCVVDATGRIVFREAREMFEEDVAALARFAAN